MTVSTVAFVVLYVAAVAVTAHGWGTIPSERRFTVSLGVPPSVEGTVGKRTGLLSYLLIDTILFVGSLAADSTSIKLIGLLLLLFFLVIESHAVNRMKARA